MEKINKAPETEPPVSPGSEDVILEKLHRCTDGHSDCTPRDAELMHKDFEACESYQWYESYKRNQMPTFERMENGIQAILCRIPESIRNDAEAQRLSKLLKGRTLVIKGAVRSYVETVLKFVRLQHTAAAMRNTEVFVKIDHERRRRHDNLLKSLTDTRKLFEDAADYGLLERGDYREWIPGEEAEVPEGVVPVFSLTAIANRDLIKNWALAADFAEHYEKLIKILEQKE